MYVCMYVCIYIYVCMYVCVLNNTQKDVALNKDTKYTKLIKIAQPMTHVSEFSQ
jgi:hypothetical protein